MSSAGTRTRSLPLYGPAYTVEPNKQFDFYKSRKDLIAEGKQITVSESHARDRKTGSYREGGPFYTSRVSRFLNPGSVARAFRWDQLKFYTGPVYGPDVTLSEMEQLGFKNTSLQFGDRNESQMETDGTNAISYASPINPASQLGTTLAESIREGIPSLPGIQSWKRRTEAAKAAGSEYLNAQFGWLPLIDEVSSVRDAARHHRDVMNQYHRNEGRNTHRRFDFPLQRTSSSITGTGYPNFPFGPWWILDGKVPSREVSLVRETKRWFEGVFTYALPSSTDSWRKGLGFGSEADQLFGFALSPDILWELTPWSWAVDWFSNAGEVINNATNFGLAGQVMRYGYMMEESIERITVRGGRSRSMSTSEETFPHEGPIVESTPWSRGIEIVTKRRLPASPFGFSVGWEGLSPTQLAITAALGITRVL